MTRRPTASAHHGEAAALMALAAAALAGTMLVASMPHASGQVRLPDDTVVRTSAPDAQAGPRDTYRSRVRDEMADWRDKMRSFDERLETQGKRDIDAAETRLREAWNDTEIEARNVQAATARDWERTKQAYEGASRRMAEAWDKVRL